MTTIYFDMDGVLANLYSRPTWLEELHAENVAPYAEAEPLKPESTLANLAAKGYRLGIISWTCRGGSKAYNKQVRKTKIEWLAKHYPNIKFEEIHIVAYGTPKWKVASDRNGILVDDEEPNRKAWKGTAIHPNELA